MELAHRRRLVARDYMRGLTQVEIAQKYALNQSTISRDLEAVRQEWLKQAATEYETAIARELAKIDELERTFWEAWMKSMEPGVEIERRRRLPKKGESEIYELPSGVQRQADQMEADADTIEAEAQAILETPGMVTTSEVVKKVQRLGDARYLAGVQWCIHERSRLLGLHTPTTVNQVNVGVVNGAHGRSGQTIEGQGEVLGGTVAADITQILLQIGAFGGVSEDTGAEDPTGPGSTLVSP